MEDNREEAIAVLNRLVELELAGAVRYTQYSLMIFGHARIPIMHWMRQQASEALLHATEAGEEVTADESRWISESWRELITHQWTIFYRS
jgi:bacterioferritin